LLLLEWLGGLAFVPLAFRWGIPVIRRRFALSGASHFAGRVTTPSLVMTPLREGGWMFRAPFRVLGVSTPFPLHGMATPLGDAVSVVGRHPVGGLIFLSGAIGSSVLAALAPLVVPALAAQGIETRLSTVWVYLAFFVLFYGGSLAIERWRFLRAVGDLRKLLGGGEP
jgi:hypothetical protein